MTWTLYWLSTLDGIKNFAFDSMIIGIILSIIFFVITVIYKIDNGSGEISEQLYRYAKNVLKITIPVVFLCIFIRIFVPSTKQAYIIYGVGNTLEYLKNNDEAKKLPDNVLKVCNKYLEDIIEEKNDSIK